MYGTQPREGASVSHYDAVCACADPSASSIRGEHRASTTYLFLLPPTTTTTTTATTAMAPIRLRHPKGVSTIQIDLDTATVLALQHEIFGITEIPPSLQERT